MKEQEPKPAKCWSQGKDCMGQIMPYAFVENPKIRMFDLCVFHANIYAEAVRKYEGK